MAERSTSSLLENQNALSAYLDDLLQEATEVAVNEALGQPVEEACSNLIFETLNDEPDRLQLDALASELVNEKDTIDEQDRVPEDPELRISFPAQFLMFTIGPIKLSIPLIELNSVLKTDAEMTHLPGSGDWIEGVLSHRDQNVKIVDSRKLLKIAGETSSQNNDQRRFLVLAAGDVALSCDSVETIITLDRDEIHWRRMESNDLFSGTIRKSLASVLDTELIVSFLDRLNAGGVPRH
jgi:purine-binding chemotaxis protein CheW